MWHFFSFQMGWLYATDIGANDTAAPWLNTDCRLF
jgi:hypothetical protein